MQSDETFDDYINVLHVRLNTNHHARTLEELLERRRTFVEDLFENLKLEAYHDHYCGDDVVKGLNHVWSTGLFAMPAHDYLHIEIFKSAIGNFFRSGRS